MMKSKWKGMELFKSGDDFEKVSRLFFQIYSLMYIHPGFVFHI